MSLSIVVATSDNNVIGRRDELPWYLPEDLQRFRDLTLGHSVIMGRRTLESITARLGHPLKHRYTIALSHRGLDISPEYGISAASLDEALAAADVFRDGHRQRNVFVAGGASVYEQTLAFVDRVYLTRVHQVAEGDTYFPETWLRSFDLVHEDDTMTSSTGLRFTFSLFARR